MSDIALQFAQNFAIDDAEKINKINEYCTIRAYPLYNTVIVNNVELKSPYVDVVASAFRETRGGKSITEENSDDGRVGPVWNAIRSTVSATDALKKRRRESAHQWVHGLGYNLSGPERFKRQAAFFLDTEILRTVYFHSFVVLNSRLWLITNSGMKEIRHARVIIDGIDDGIRQVDIVNSNFKDEYLSEMTSSFKREAQKSVNRLKRFISRIGWRPGAQREELASIVGL